jgi:hypothetical protein
MAITRILTPLEVRRFSVYDLEWHPQKLELRLLGLYDGRRYRSFLHVEDFLTHVLTREYEGQWLFAHWGGATDITFFLEWFHKNGFHVDLRFSGSSAVFCEVSRGRRKWKFVDSFFLLRAPLRKIMEKLGMAKGGAEGDQDIFVANIEELTDYNENDCRGLYLAVSRFQERMISMGTEMCPTIASTAMRLFRRQYLKADIPTDDAQNLIARKAYVASRVEVFSKEIEEAWQYDINSSFPSSMILPAPGAYLSTQKHVPKDGDLFFADVTLTVPVCDFPPLPKRLGGKVFFPIGSWRAWVCGADFRALERYARIDTVHEVHLYDGRDDMAAYVTDIYEHRRQSQDEFDREIDKLLMNALYGKWSERTEKSTVVIGGDHDVAWYEAAGIEASEIFPGAIRIEENRAIEHEHPPFSAHITAHSREKILTLLLQARDAAYCDTDSCTTKAMLPTSGSLGDIKLEKLVHHGFYHAPKFYCTDGTEFKIWEPESPEDRPPDGAEQHGGAWYTKKARSVLVKAKGFSKVLDGDAIERSDGSTYRKQKKLGRDDFQSLIQNGFVEMERMTRPKEMLRRHGMSLRKGEKHVLAPEMMQIQKRLQTYEQKREFSADGRRSRPFTVTELIAKYGDT